MTFSSDYKPFYFDAFIFDSVRILKDLDLHQC